MNRCAWCLINEKMTRYHDEEWGVMLKDDQKQFEFLMLEVMQCGLNWNMMIQKREIFRQCFDNFDYKKIAGYNETDIEQILSTPGMIRSPRKIMAIIHNARRFMDIQQEFGSFCSYLENFSQGKMLVYKNHWHGNMPAKNELSDTISADLKKRGFKYLGSVTVYSHLQACGIINDHEPECFCYTRLCQKFPVVFLDK